MTSTAGIRLLRRPHNKLAAFRDAGGSIHLPLSPAAVVEVDRQGRASRAGPCTRNVARRRTVAGLAADVYFCPGGREGVIFHVVIFLKIRGVALGTHVVPVLLTAGPVKGIVMRDEFVRIQVEPALPAVGAVPGIPGNRQRLNVPAW